MPWAIGKPYPVRKNGKMSANIGPNPTLISYKEALAEDLKGLSLDSFGEELLEVRFLFWRQVDTWNSAAGRRQVGNYADATNLQKSTEDALQGVLFKNDRQVKRVSAEIIEQTPETYPTVAIWITIYQASIEPWVTEAVNMRDEERKEKDVDFDNSW